MDCQVTSDAVSINNSDADTNFGSNNTPIREDEPISVPVNQTDELYKMDHEKRGHALIFSQENFESNLELTQRSGSHTMAEKVKVTLENLKFEVEEIYKDYTYPQIMNKVNELQRHEDLEKSDCILIIVMTHGRNNDHLYAQNTHYPLHELQRPFTTKKCPKLAGKPKLFILQACRGTKQDKGFNMMQSSAITQTDGPISIYRLPAHADFLTAHCTAPKYTAYRKPFIEAFCEELSSEEVKRGRMDFLSMLTNVQRKVAIETHEGRKQMPSVTSTLTRKIFFK